MSITKKVGALLFVIGMLATLFTGFNLVTREKVIDIGELEIMGNRNHRLDWEPALGFAVMLVGSVVYAFGSFKKINGPPPLSR